MPFIPEKKKKKNRKKQKKKNRRLPVAPGCAEKESLNILLNMSGSITVPTWLAFTLCALFLWALNPFSGGMGGLRAPAPLDSLPAPLDSLPALSAALPAPSVCNSEQVAMQVGMLDKSQSKCPGHAWWPHFVAAAMTCRPVTVVNVGANKGYSLASFADLFAPELGLTPAAIYPRIMARFGDAEHGGSVSYPCGACDDCRVGHLRSASTRTCVLPSGEEVPATDFSTDIHGFEPIAANLDIMRAGVMAVAEEASVPNTRIHLHRVAVVGDATLEAVPFGMCPPGLERCGVEAAGTEGKVAYWNHDHVKIESVPATTVDDMADKFGIEADFDVLAVDTEGLDPEVIDGAEGMLRAHRIKVLEFEYRE